ncbi:3'-5' exonuclease [Alkalicoccus chagannorensis]|uniref:3'-5' exonuclease n=1 Tax=Alkalicoccus chagannorensis TaxID=427072 RepID=UPI00040450B0|nr:3'-5' exonuclease [Alkalicoccus chagannorensis]
MAVTVPESIRRTATKGERLLFETLKHYLDDDYIVYFEPSIHGRRPDFLIIGPMLGIVVLEVKDYTLQTLHQLNRDEWIIQPGGSGLKTVPSPLKQARGYMFHLQDLLKKEHLLVHQTGDYAGRLTFPCGYGTVFTRLSQEQCVEHDIYNVIEPSFLLTREEIDPEKDAFDAGILIEKLLQMFTVQFRLRDPLSVDQINAIRYHLFPEFRISGEFRQPAPYQDQLLLSMHDLKAMDLHQEKLAKQLGGSNRLIRGTAGSGKTLILASRARLIRQEHPEWKVLVLCYNISLSRSLKEMIRAKMEEPLDLLDTATTAEERMQGMTIRNFHEWLKQDLHLSEHALPQVLEKLEQGEALLPQYDAVLIDEGQDFKPEWLTLIRHLLRGEEPSMLLVEDRAQSIYRRGGSYLKQTGLDFRGRSKVLQINYRNTEHIVRFAWDFFQRHAGGGKVVQGELDGQEIIPPQSTKRRGPEPVLHRASGLREEVQLTAKTIRKLHEEKQVPYEEMLILYRVKRTHRADIVQRMRRALEQEEIPFTWITETPAAKRDYVKHNGTVKLSTIDSSKGLDFQAVFIISAEHLPFALEEDEAREAALFYIGMTRAIDYLMITYSGDSAYTAYFDDICRARDEDAARKERDGPS